MSIESVMPSNYLILCRPRLLLSSVFPSNRVFSNESVLHIRWPKYLCFSFSITPSNEYSGLTSFRIDWFDLLAVQGILKSPLQQHRSKAQVLQCSIFTAVHGDWKNHSFEYMDLCQKRNVSVFYMLSRFVIAFLPKSKCLFISWLKLLYAVILEPKKIKSATVCTVSPSISHEVMGPDAMILGPMEFNKK